MLKFDGHSHDEWGKVEREWNDCMERKKVFLIMIKNNGVLEEGKVLKLWQLKGAKHA